MTALGSGRPGDVACPELLPLIGGFWGQRGLSTPVCRPFACLQDLGGYAKGGSMNALCFTSVNPSFTPFNLKQYSYPGGGGSYAAGTLTGPNQVNYFITDAKSARLSHPPSFQAQSGNTAVLTGW